jgi:glycosyltransferase involved in cell wall biosynthesis
LSNASTGRPILFIHSSDEMYGSDRMLLEVVEALPEEYRARALVWLPSDYGHGENPLCEQLQARGIAFDHVDLPVIRRRYLNPRGLWGMAGRGRSVRRRLAQVDPGEIFLVTSAVLPIAPLLGRKGRTRVFFYMQEIWHGNEGRGLATLARRVDRVVAISEASKASLPEYLQRRTVVVPNGTREPEAYQPVAPNDDGLVFLMAGRWDFWKGHTVLLEAWDAADCPGRLIIVGSPSVLGTGVDVDALVAASKRPDTIEVRGVVPDIGGVIDESDVMLVPSTQPEPFGLVTIEAFARGRPAITSAHGGLLETVQDGAGWLVPPNDVPALAERLRTVTAADVVAAGQAARRRYEEHYSRAAFRPAMAAALTQL